MKYLVDNKVGSIMRMRSEVWIDETRKRIEIAEQLRFIRDMLSVCGLVMKWIQLLVRSFLAHLITSYKGGSSLHRY